MVFQGLVDELRVSISPVILGGIGGVSFMDGPIQPSLNNGMPLKLLETKALGDSFILRYQVLKNLS